MEIRFEVQLHRKMSFVVDDGDSELYPLLVVHVVRHPFLALFVVLLVMHLLLVVHVVHHRFLVLFVFSLVLHPVADVLVFFAVTLLDGATDALLYPSVVVPF
jgi:hypothetical protein